MGYINIINIKMGIKRERWKVKEMELKNIEAFLTVAEKGSFSAAAESLYISQPTISVRIQQLERELNFTLFERENGKKTVLTPFGKKIFPYLNEAFQLIEKVPHILKVESNIPQKFAISCTNHMGVEIMPEILKILYDSFPGLDFLINIKSNEEIIEDICAGTIDIGFADIYPKEVHENLSVTKIADEKNILVCAPNHPLTKLTKISPKDLENERIIVFNREFITTKIISEFLMKNQLKEYKEVEISNVGWLKMMVRKGLGVAFLQEIIVKEELKNGTLKKISLNKTLPQTSIFLFLNESIPLNIKQTMINTSKKIFSQINR